MVGQSNLAGDLTVHPFLWDKGVLTDLGTLEGGLAGRTGSTMPERLSALLTPRSAVDGFLWKKGVITDLGTVDRALSRRASTQRVSRWCSFDCMVEGGYAWLWEGGSITDLNTFVPPGSSLQQLVVAFNINDSGEIDGLGVPPGVDPADVFNLGHVFVLIPCDDNHPGVEGCDYSVMEASTGVPHTSPAAHDASSRVSPQSLMRRMNRYHFPGLAFGPRN